MLSISRLPVNVLIETYWNVKNGGSRNKQEAVKCINRNILECKGGTTWNYTYETKVLIETYWNVKMKSKGKDREIFRKVLIETYWNVKKISAIVSTSSSVYY